MHVLDAGSRSEDVGANVCRNPERVARIVRRYVIRGNRTHDRGWLVGADEGISGEGSGGNRRPEARLLSLAVEVRSSDRTLPAVAEPEIQPADEIGVLGLR